MWLRPPRSPGSLLRPLLPSFISNALWPDQKPTYKLHPTSYLDGLRGVASFIVFIYHYTEPNHGYFIPTYGLNGDKPSAFLQLPFVRMIYCGRPMVHIFFVISGFVLSYKPLQAIYAGDPQKCYTVLASATFRRPVRLFLPCVIDTFFIAILMQLGLAFAPSPSIWEAAKKWVTAIVYQVCWPWSWDDEAFLPYDGHLWTIPIEFNQSLLLFMGLLCMAPLRQRVRQAATVAIVAYSLAAGKWAVIEFFSGLFLAERHVLRSLKSDTDTPAVTAPSAVPRWRRCLLHPSLKKLVHIGALIFAFYIGGWPNRDEDKTWGIAFLNRITPSSFHGHDMPQRLWFAVGAVLVVWSAGELATVKRFLEGGFSQYLGRISYAIYIMHGPILEVIQGRVIGLPHVEQKGNPGEDGYVAGIPGHGVKGMFGHETPAQQMTSWAVAFVLLMPPVVWGSDLFWRAVDVPVVSLGRRMENACLERDKEEG